MVGVSVVYLICNTRNHTECLAVTRSEFTRQTFGRSGEDGEIVLILLTVFIGAVTHVADDFQSECLCLLTFTVMLADESDETFCKTDETDAESTLVDYTLDSVIGAKFLSACPQTRHQKGNCFTIAVFWKSKRSQS